MANNQRTTVSNTISSELKLQMLDVPKKVADNIQPVILADAKICNIVRSGFANNAISTSIYTTPADKDFYLVSCNLAVIKDSTSTSTSTQLRCVIDGLATANVLIIPSITLTPQNAFETINFNIPLKLDRNSSINIVNTTNVANIVSSGTIIGYTVEPL